MLQQIARRALCLIDKMFTMQEELSVMNSDEITIEIDPNTTVLFEEKRIGTEDVKRTKASVKQPNSAFICNVIGHCLVLSLTGYIRLGVHGNAIHAGSGLYIPIG
ncbi:MAG: hypothetical protein A4E63_02817 [Syntrophorhabdus sp. PtaU1.Bin050]|nr:MAG: hypothetical protein A4E63_02817 [Syntrophorhabdus sp. PtaU1.Bin050]